MVGKLSSAQLVRRFGLIEMEYLQDWLFLTSCCTIDENEPSPDFTNVLCVTNIYQINGSSLFTMFSVNGETKEIKISYEGIIN